MEIVGASRTDSGAHALGQVCHFDTGVPIEGAKWPRVLNKVMPDDISVTQAEEVAPDFHSRFCAEHRRYLYRIKTAPRDPMTSRYVHDYGRPLNLEKMKEGASYLVGEHDFLAFTEELDPSVENTRRKLLSVEVSLSGPEVHIEIVGTAFLRGMMRRMSGALLEIGRGHRPPSDIEVLLSTKRTQLQWPVVLPAKGLTLLEVAYADPPRDNRTASIQAEVSPSTPQ